MEWRTRGKGAATHRESDACARITVIVACLNSVSYIGRCLESIVNQDYADSDIVVADGGSTDGTVEILRRYAMTMGPRLSWESGPDFGLADAWNKAVRHARGDWFIFLGADDALCAPDVLSRIAPRLAAAFPRHSVVYGNVAMTDAAGRVVDFLDQPWSAAKFRGCVANLQHSAVFHHRSLFDRHGAFDASFAITCDYDFLLRELRETEPLHIEDLVVTNAQIGGMSTDYRRRLQAIGEHIRLSRRHAGRISPMMYWWIAKAWGGWLLYQLGGDRLVFPATNLYRGLVKGRPPLRRRGRCIR
jgi:glycosyltransferase involved in cell wall biosynthesis